MERKKAPVTHQPARHKAHETTEAREAVALAEQKRWLSWGLGAQKEMRR